MLKHIGLEYVSRSGTKTLFKINNNENVQKNIDLILRCICFYTLAIFQTDSIEQKIFYKKKNQIFIDTIINIIQIHMFNDDSDDEDDKKDINTTIKNNDKNNDKNNNNNNNDDDDDDDDHDNNYNRDEDNDDGHNNYHVEDDRIDNVSRRKEDKYLDKYINDELHTYNDELILDKLKNIKIKGVVRYNSDITFYINDAMLQRSTNKKAYDLKKQKSREVICHEVLDDNLETMGNYGNYVEYGHKVKNKVIKNIKKYIAFDLDKFMINVKKIDEVNYKMKFNNLNGIHHASSMWASRCLVSYKDEDITSSEYVDEITAKLIYDDDSEFIHIETSYFAIDCL